MMSKSTVKLLIALAAAAGAIYLLNKSATNVKKMIDKRQENLFSINVRYPSGIILS